MSLNTYTEPVKFALKLMSHKAISHNPFTLNVLFNSTVKLWGLFSL